MKTIHLITTLLFLFSSALGQDRKGNPPEEIIRYFFVELITNPDKPYLEQDKVDSLQRAHMANIALMIEEGKLMLAGPFEKGGGIFILLVPDLEEAEKLVARDPLIKTRRLLAEIRPWYTAKGAFTLENAGKMGERPRPDTAKSDEVIDVNVTLNCSIDKAFDYFTDNAKLVKWLTTKADVVLAKGGKYELFWTPENGDPTNNSTYGCKILAFEKPYYLNVEWKGNADQKSFMNNVRPLTNVHVQFIQLSKDTTKVILVHSGWRQGETWESAGKYFISAWNGAFSRLENEVNTKG